MEKEKKNLIVEGKTVKATPLMEQYLNIKEKTPGSLLFFRMGDFYELFFEDAYLASEVLDITLTKRGNMNGKEIPMCGVPHHSSERYIQTLIKKGLHVSICEQVESPQDAKKRGYKAIVKREVVRTITPGTLFEENLLDSNQSNYLLSINFVRDEIAFAWTDISEGTLFLRTVAKEELESVLARIKPTEILISNKNSEEYFLHLKKKDYKVVVISDSSFNTTNAENRILQYY